MRAGNSNNGTMTIRGYKSIAEKYFSCTNLRHSVKQLRNRWGQLKGLYQFWMWLNKHTGLGRANGTVVADDKFWKDHTKVYLPMCARFFSIVRKVYYTLKKIVRRANLNGRSVVTVPQRIYRCWSKCLSLWL